MATRTAKWHTTEHDSTWEKVKAAFQRDWEQTKHDFGSKNARDLDQDVDDTVKQMFGSNTSHNYRDMKFEDAEHAFRYGHAARHHYGKTHDRWNDKLRGDLRRDYDGDWERDEPLIRYSYGYNRPR